MKEWFKKMANVFAWAIGILIVLAALFTSVYFFVGWNKKDKKEDKESEGSITNPSSKLDKLHHSEICGAINSLWKNS